MGTSLIHGVGSQVLMASGRTPNAIGSPAYEAASRAPQSAAAKPKKKLTRMMAEAVDTVAPGLDQKLGG